MLQASLRFGASGDVPGSAASTELPLSCEGQPTDGGDPGTRGCGGGGGGEDPPAVEAASPHRGGPASSFSRPSVARPFRWKHLFSSQLLKDTEKPGKCVYTYVSFHHSAQGHRSGWLLRHYPYKAGTLLLSQYGQGYTELVKLTVMVSRE